MPKEIATKSTFGTVKVNNISPALSSTVPKAINMVISFEESLKLQLGLQSILLKLNSYNRNTKAGQEEETDDTSSPGSLAFWFRIYGRIVCALFAASTCAVGFAAR